MFGVHILEYLCVGNIVELSRTMPMTNIQTPQPILPNIRWEPYLSYTIVSLLLKLLSYNYYRKLFIKYKNCWRIRGLGLE